MLDEICPIQFIEGVNENAELVTDKFLQVRSYERVAIQFIPTIAFLLVEMEIYVVWGNIGKREIYDVKLRSGHKGNPTNFFLSSGELSFEPTASGYGWRKIDIKHPVVVIPKKQYWLDLESSNALFHLGRTEKGDEAEIRAMVSGVWSAGNSRPECPMLRLYGQVLPVVS